VFRSASAASLLAFPPGARFEPSPASGRLVPEI
jgi:hypothetical protein